MKKSEHIPVYILCGGKSSRMKSEKGLVELKGRSFVQHVIDAAKGISEEIYLVTQNQAYAKLGCPLIADNYVGQGPLAGIQAALSHTSAKAIFVLSCDVPLLETSVLDALLADYSENTESIVLISGKQQIQPLIAIYRRNLLNEITARLEKGHNKLLDFVNDIAHRIVEIENPSILKNINTPEELLKIKNR